SLVTAPEHEPGHRGGDADQHREGIVIEIAGLQPHDVAGHVDHPRRHAVGAETVDQPTVPVAPEHVAEPERWPHENEIVKLIEVPLVEQETVEPRLLARELDRERRIADIEFPRHREADGHHDGRYDGNQLRDMLHVLEDMIAGAELERVAEERLDPGTDE